MTEVAIISDDLTGAADTGVQFCPYLRHPILLSYRDLPADFDTEASQVLAVYTNTRSLKPETAQRRVRSVAKELLALYPKRVYKKVDSCLRGNIGAELDVILEEMGFELSFIAPAFPRMGRTTVHDIHLVHGIPVGETELSRDPITPVTESRLSSIVAAQSRYPVAHMDIRFLGRDDDQMDREIGHLISSGARHVVFDAKHQAHLDRIVRFALGGSRKTILVGSAGLAGSLGNHFQKRDSDKEQKPSNLRGGHHLLVSGTLSEQTRRQLLALLEFYPCHVIDLAPHHLLDPVHRDALISKVGLAHRLLAENDLIIRIDSCKESQPESLSIWLPRKAELLVRGLGWLVASLLRETTPASLFLTGGDTASAVLRAIGAKGIRLLREILPGVALGTLIGSSLDGLPVVTKAGAFGEKGTLVKLHDYWARRRRAEEDGC